MTMYVFYYYQSCVNIKTIHTKRVQSDNNIIILLASLDTFLDGRPTDVRYNTHNTTSNIIYT